MDVSRIGCNQHTWHLSANDQTQSFAAMWEAGLLWNSGFEPARSAATPHVSAENVMALPFFLEREGEKQQGVCAGDGPIDAAFLAIEQIIGHHYELADYQIQTVTEGREAMGSALVKLRSNGRLYSGNGISTDIIGASIRAYISALNKIMYEEV